MPSVKELSDICIPMVDEPAYTTRRLRVVTVGAGFSGLVMAHKIQHEFPELQNFIDHTIFELLDDVGGTWRVNTYPGVMNDVPSHIYVGSPRNSRLVLYTVIYSLCRPSPSTPKPTGQSFTSRAMRSSSTFAISPTSGTSEEISSSGLGLWPTSGKRKQGDGRLLWRKRVRGEMNMPTF